MLYIDDRQEKIKPTEELIDKIKATIDFALKEEGVKVPYQISLLFVDNEEIRKINRENRSIDRETDVLSFPMLDYEKDKVYKDMYLYYDFDETFMDGDELVLGDIVLSLEKALEQSKEYNNSFERETSYLVIHSVLHLLGYDNIKKEEKKIMRNEEEKILSKMNIVRG